MVLIGLETAGSFKKSPLFSGQSTDFQILEKLKWLIQLRAAYEAYKGNLINRHAATLSRPSPPVFIKVARHCFPANWKVIYSS